MIIGGRGLRVEIDEMDGNEVPKDEAEVFEILVEVGKVLEDDGELCNGGEREDVR